MKIVICANTESIENGGVDIPDELLELELDSCADAWFDAAKTAAIEIADDCDYDGDFRHYNGGPRRGLVDIDLNDTSYDHPACPNADTVIDTIYRAAQQAVWRCTAAGAEALSKNIAENPADWDGETVEKWTALAAEYEQQAAAITVDLDAAKKAWAELVAAYTEPETETEEEK